MIGAPRSRRVAQRGQHARMVGAGVLAEDEDARRRARSPRASPCPCRRRSTAAGRRWSPRGTCSSSRGNCWCRIRARTAGRGRPPRWRCGPRCRTRPCSDVEQLVSAAPMRGERLVPGDRHDSGRCRVVAPSDGSGGPASSSAWSVQSHSSVTVCAAKNSGVRALGRRFPGHRLGAVLAELERRGVLRVGPGAARAVEAVRLVHPQQRPCLRARPISCRTALVISRRGAPASRRPGIGLHPGVGFSAMSASITDSIRCQHSRSGVVPSSSIGLPGTFLPIM